MATSNRQYTLRSTNTPFEDPDTGNNNNNNGQGSTSTGTLPPNRQDGNGENPRIVNPVGSHNGNGESDGDDSASTPSSQHRQSGHSPVDDDEVEGEIRRHERVVASLQRDIRLQESRRKLYTAQMQAQPVTAENFMTTSGSVPAPKPVRSDSVRDPAPKEVSMATI